MALDSKVKAFVKKIAAAEATGGNTRFVDGTYDLTILAIRLEDKDCGMSFIVDFLVDKSEDVPESYWIGQNAVWQGTDKAVHLPAIKAGRPVGYLTVVDPSKNKSGLGNARAFMDALNGDEELSDEDFEAALEFIISDDQPAKGMRIKATTYRKKIKTGDNQGKPFVAIRWEHVEQSEEEVKARRAEVDKVKPAEEKAA